MTNPWFKFYPTDWKADANLKLCSAAARGLWIEMLCICHTAIPYGHLLINGSMPTDSQLTTLTGIPTEQISGLISELSSLGIFSRTAKGIIYSRKMVRDEQKAKESRKNGKFGGNPNLSKQRIKSSGVNPSVKAGVKPQKPEARIVFTGKVIKLKEETFNSLLSETEMNDKEFASFLDKEDEYYAKLPPPEKAKWFFFLRAKIKKMRFA